MILLEKIEYKNLNAKAKEMYNFQKVSAVLADYGFTTMWLNNDWQGADFIAVHIDGNTNLKVQLKARLTFDEKYIGKDIYICFIEEENVYLYPHDELMILVPIFQEAVKTKSGRSMNQIPKKYKNIIDKYILLK